MKSGFFLFLIVFFSTIQFFYKFAIKPFLSISIYSFVSVGSNFVNNGYYFLKELRIGLINITKSFAVLGSLVV